ncbi:MAG: hypothetical protein ABIB04_02050 [Patescibacteria group bacterium]
MNTSPNNVSGRLSADELQFASWWVKNGALVRRSVYILLAVLLAITWGYSLWGLLDAYAISYPRESRITGDIALNQQRLSALEQDIPQNVTLSEVHVLQTVDERYDMSVEIVNPNGQWWAEFNYRFNFSGEMTPVETGYVLPQGTQILTELGYKPKAKGGRTAILVIDNVRWHRVDPDMVGSSYKDFVKDHLAISFDKIKYDTDISFDTKKIGQTSFILVNNGAYGYRSLDLIVRIYRGSVPAAINQISITNLSPGERRPIQMVWLENLPGISKTEIIPQVNLLDKDSYLPTQYFK